MIDILKVILPTFSVILIGYFFGKTKKPDMTAVVELVFYLGLPAIAFTSVIDKSIVLLDATKMWISALMIMFGCGITAWIVFQIFSCLINAVCFSKFKKLQVVVFAIKVVSNRSKAGFHHGRAHYI